MGKNWSWWRHDYHPNDKQPCDTLQICAKVWHPAITVKRRYDECHTLAFCPQCQYADCRYAESRGAILVLLYQHQHSNVDI
jgi:hypothetical protein